MWDKERLSKNESLQSATNTGEVFILDRKEKGDKLESGNVVKRGYAIYKLINLSNNSEAYILTMENEFTPSLYNPPMLLAEEQVIEFLNNPEIAANYAYNQWLNCYR